MNKHLSVWLVILFYLFTAAAVLIVSLKLTNGDFVYALDDAYIHMAMAKNLVNNGHWAANQLEFTSASSSPLWVLIISAVYFVFGVNTITPLILNLLFGVFAIILFYAILKKYDVNKYCIIFLLAFIYITPLPAMLFGGMEHSAQIVLALLFAFIGAKLISDPGKNKNYSIAFLIITPFFTAIRYEDLILTAIVCFLLFVNGRKLFAVLALILGLVPPVLYGIISTGHGWLFLPNTILLKSSPPEFSTTGLVRFCFKAFSNITEPHVFILLIIMSLLYAFNFKRLKSFRNEKQILLFVTAAAMIINMSLIEYHHNGAFYRYEAYLMALGIAAICISIYDFLPDVKLFFSSVNTNPGKYLVIAFVLLAISPLFVRAFTLFGIPHAQLEYHNQQYQMAQFVKLYAKDMVIGLNDIGMVNYCTENKVIDLWGVSDMTVAKQRLDHIYSTETINALAKKENLRLVICYEHWFDEYGGLPASWEKIAEWTMEDYNFFLGNSTVAVYAVNNEDVVYLKEKLDEFSDKMPKSVTYKIY